METAEERTSRRDVVAELDAFFFEQNRRQVDLLQQLVEFDKERGWERDGYRSMSDWLVHTLDYSPENAVLTSNAVRVLDSLPRLSEALETGELSVEKVLHLARFATPETETELIEWARDADVDRIASRAQK